MVLYANRSKYEKFSIKIGSFFAKFGLTPNQWTYLSLVPAAVSVYFLTQGQFINSSIAFIIAGFLDVVDGGVARVTGRATKFGAYLDTIVDRFVEGGVILALFFVELPSLFLPVQFWLGFYLFGSMMTTYVKAAAKEKELTERKEIKGGLLERAERISLLFAGIFLAGYLNTIYLTYTLIALSVLANFTALQRIYIASKLKN